jgi:hypothetical protein
MTTAFLLILYVTPVIALFAVLTLIADYLERRHD